MAHVPEKLMRMTHPEDAFLASTQDRQHVSPGPSDVPLHRHRKVRVRESSHSEHRLKALRWTSRIVAGQIGISGKRKE